MKSDILAPGIPLVHSSEMRQIDQAAAHHPDAMQKLQTGYQYMHKAASALLWWIEHYLEKNSSASTNTHDGIWIFCGKGNNGGDGLVLARLLYEKQIPVKIWAPFTQNPSTTDEASHVVDLALSDFMEQGLEFEKELPPASVQPILLVDAFLGTGMQGGIKEKYKSWVHAINQIEAPCLSIDCPSGYDTQIPKRSYSSAECVKADFTMLMGYSRSDAWLNEAPEYYGDIFVADLDYPPELQEQICTSQKKLIALLPQSELLPARSQYAAKQKQGIVSIIAGSRGMTGAPVFSAMAALRSGAGMSYLALPECIIDTISTKVNEPVLHSFSSDGKGFSFSALSELLNFTQKAHALAIGPGLGKSSDLHSILKEILKNYKGKLVIDADGLNNLQGNTQYLKECTADWVITPHQGEFKQLFGDYDYSSPLFLDQLAQLAQDLGGTILFKGPPACIANAQGEVFLFPVFNSALATAGTGDILAGIIISFMAQGLNAFDAAWRGLSYFYQLGEEGRTAFGEHALIAGDLLELMKKSPAI
jgi:NAD(P)H-hydrate epimerase